MRLRFIPALRAGPENHQIILGLAWAIKNYEPLQCKVIT